ncbi:MAG: flagellar biosynthetic protein FliO [Deltaproteobacteria bacterium]|nr:flagellar biosynthetic protein FliO [Deltaproteobacteria bacterium]
MAGMIEKLIGGMFLVIVMIWGAAYVYLRFFGARMQGQRNLIRVVTAGALGPKKTIAVVDVAGQYLVVGVTPDSITYLSKIEDGSIFENHGRPNGKEGQAGKAGWLAVADGRRADVLNLKNVIDRIANLRVKPSRTAGWPSKTAGWPVRTADRTIGDKGLEK